MPAYAHAPPHFYHQVRNHLDREMAWRYIGGGGFTLCGHVKNIVYQVRNNDLQNLKDRIREAVATVTPNILQATWNEVEYRLDIFRVTKGSHIEIY
jgi:hypothetical protein